MGRDVKCGRGISAERYHCIVTIVMSKLQIEVTKAALSVMSSYIRCATIAFTEFTTVLSLFTINNDAVDSTECCYKVGAERAGMTPNPACDVANLL